MWLFRCRWGRGQKSRIDGIFCLLSFFQWNLLMCQCADKIFRSSSFFLDASLWMGLGLPEPLEKIPPHPVPHHTTKHASNYSSFHQASQTYSTFNLALFLKLRILHSILSVLHFPPLNFCLRFLSNQYFLKPLKAQPQYQVPLSQDPPSVPFLFSLEKFLPVFTLLKVSNYTQ